MRDHLDVDVAIPQRRKQPPRNPDAPFQLQSHETDDSHVLHDVHGAVFAQLLNRTLQVLVLTQQVFRILLPASFLGAFNDGHLRVHRQTDVELVLFEEIDIQRARGEDLADLREEVCIFEFAVGVDVHDGDVVFYCYGSRALGMEWWVSLGCWRDEGAGALRGEDVLDADWD